MMRSLLAPACVLAIGAVVLAQTPVAPLNAPPTTAPAATQPKTPQQTVDEMLKPGADRRPALTPIEGAPKQNLATINPVDPAARPATLKREGGYVVDRTGRITPSADGKSVEFNFEADANALQDPPMVLLPNLTLMMMQNNQKFANRDLRFRITGMVTEYMGRNYLLVQKAVTVTD